MTNTVKITLYVVIVVLLSTTITLWIESHSLENEKKFLNLRLEKANVMYQDITGCDFTPPFFNPPITLETADNWSVSLSVKHTFEDEKQKAGTVEYQNKIDRLIVIVQEVVKSETLETLKTDLTNIEENITQSYASLHIEKVKEFKIIQICSKSKNDQIQ